MTVVVNPSNESDKISTAAIDNSFPMGTSTSTVVSSYAAQAADTAILAIANSKTAVRFWDSGTFLNGTPHTGDLIVFTDVLTVLGGGNAVFYLTSDHTSSGTALCSSIVLNSVRGGWVDSAGNYNPGQPSVASAKAITVPGTKQASTGATVLGVGVLTTITYPAQPNGTTVTLVAWGISI